MIAEGVGDFAPKFISYNSIDSSNTSAREAAKKHLIENDLPKMWRYFETLLLQNNGGKGFFVGNKVYIVKCIDQYTSKLYSIRRSSVDILME